jgi:hypothetical protein
MGRLRASRLPLRAAGDLRARCAVRDGARVRLLESEVRRLDHEQQHRYYEWTEAIRFHGIDHESADDGQAHVLGEPMSIQDHVRHDGAIFHSEQRYLQGWPVALDPTLSDAAAWEVLLSLYMATGLASKFTMAARCRCSCPAKTSQTVDSIGSSAPTTAADAAPQTDRCTLDAATSSMTGENGALHGCDAHPMDEVALKYRTIGISE